MATKPHDPERQKRIDAQADMIANLLHIDPEKVATDGNYGVSLTPDQIDMLLAALTYMGFQNAIDLLKAQSEESRQSGDESGLSMWAVYLAGSSFLEAARP